MRLVLAVRTHTTAAATGCYKMTEDCRAFIGRLSRLLGINTVSHKSIRPVVLGRFIVSFSVRPPSFPLFCLIHSENRIGSTDHGAWWKRHASRKVAKVNKLSQFRLFDVVVIMFPGPIISSFFF